MAFVEQFDQLLHPTRQLRAPLPMEQPAHLPELLLRMPDVQRQDRTAEEPPQPLPQARLAVDDDLHRLVGPGREAAARRLCSRPLQGRSPRPERPVDLLVARPVQPAVLTATQGVHHHQRDAPAVLALVPLLPPPAATPALPPGPTPVALAAAVT